MNFRHFATITRPRRLPFMLAAVLATNAVLATPSVHAAFRPLPASGSQVNDDPANSIDPGQDAGVSDVTGGAITAGKVAVPWATFEQNVGRSQQIFVRAFKQGAWVTQGSPASLNIEAFQEAEAPSIDFAGAGRTVPWVTWYEPNSHFGTPTNIFASRFNAGANRWLPSGQDRADGAGVPSLNIHTNRTAENPSVAGGATIAGNDPVPWIVWEENDGPLDDDSTRQIFVAKGVKQTTAGTPCTGFKPSAANNVNGFCWQQVGLERFASAQSMPPDDTVDPTLNIDPTRAGVEPDIAFTGKNDTVVWTVWYEKNASGVPGLHSNEMVFAAKAVANPDADGGFQWVAVGNDTAGQTNVLDNSGAQKLGPCAASALNEEACSLNINELADAENPRVAAGTLTPGQPTVPWVVWEEAVGDGRHAIFVSRLVGGDHFELFNGGHPVSNAVNDATRPAITFSGNTPYITWQELIGDVEMTFVGHFEGGASAPIFKLDTPTGIASSAFGNAKDALRAPISSGCTANPFNGDGASCQGGAIGTPFFLYTAGDPGAQKLFAQAFAPTDVSTLDATDVTDDAATLNGFANPGGAAVLTHFDFGPTTAYGSSTADARLDVTGGFDAALSGLTPGDTLHFRAVAKTDFVSVDGDDQRFVVANTPPTISIDDLPDVVKSRDLGSGRVLTVHLTVSEPATITLDLLSKKGRLLREATVDQPTAGSFTADISLKRIKGKITLRVTATDRGGASAVVAQEFRAR